MTIAETWLPVVGFEGRYDVSDLARVRSITRTCRTARGTRTVPARVLKTNPHPNGYPQLTLYRDGVPFVCQVHRLVLEAFRGPCPPGLEACHGPAGPGDSSLANLRWGTHLSNCADKQADGTVARGEAHGCAKLTGAEVVEILRLGTTRMSKRAIARLFSHVSRGAVQFVLAGKTWAHVPRDG